MYFVPTIVKYCTVVYHMTYPVSHHHDHTSTCVHPLVSDVHITIFLVARPHLDEQDMTRQNQECGVRSKIPCTRTSRHRSYGNQDQNDNKAASTHVLRSTALYTSQKHIACAHAHTSTLTPTVGLPPDTILSCANRHSICAILLERCDTQSPAPPSARACSPLSTHIYGTASRNEDTIFLCLLEDHQRNHKQSMHDVQIR